MFKNRGFTSLSHRGLYASIYCLRRKLRDYHNYSAVLYQPLRTQKQQQRACIVLIYLQFKLELWQDGKQHTWTNLVQFIKDLIQSFVWYIFRCRYFVKKQVTIEELENSDMLYFKSHSNALRLLLSKFTTFIMSGKCTIANEIN